MAGEVSENRLIRRKSLGLSRRTRIGQGLNHPSSSTVTDSPCAVSLQTTNKPDSINNNKLQPCQLPQNSKSSSILSTSKCLQRQSGSLSSASAGTKNQKHTTTTTSTLSTLTATSTTISTEKTSSQDNSMLSSVSTPLNSHRSRGTLHRSGRKRLKTDFKSPRQVKVAAKEKDENIDSEDNPDNVAALTQESMKLAQEIQALRDEGITEEELQEHMKKMHEYNELKDMGQMLLGKIALIEGVTTKDLYGRFGLSLDD